MIKKFIKDEILKNNFTDNSILKSSKFFYPKVDGSFELECVVGLKKAYAILNISVADAENLRIFIDDMLICVLNGNMSKVLPMVIDKKSVLSCFGKSGELEFVLNGGTFIGDFREYSIPLKNYLVSRSGEDVEVKSFVGANSFELGEFDLLNRFSNVNSIQVGGDGKMLLLKHDNGLYLYNNADNYTSGVLVSNLSKTGVIVSSLNGCYIVYIVNGALKFREFVAGSLSDEFEIKILNNRIPIQFAIIENNAFNSSIFIVEWENNDYGLFVFEEGCFVQKLSLKGKKIKAILFSDGIDVVEMNDYTVKDYWYSILKQAGKNYFVLQDVDTYNNCDNLILINNDKFISNLNNYRKI